MKHVVVMSDLRGEDIRPPVLFSKFRELSIEDAQTFFGDPSRLVEVDCPACESAEKRPAFVKNGFRYEQCAKCKSPFVSPRPTREALEDYHRNSRAGRFRAEHYSKETAEARRHLILRSHANWMGRLYDEAGNASARSYADLGTNYPVIFDEIAELGLFDSLYSVDPIPEIDEACVTRGATVTREPLSGLGAATAFEQLEHQFSPADYLRSAHRMLAPGGMLFFTTKTISGFDLQMLWDKAPYIYVPEHLNLLSIDGITQVINRSGFELIELSTPGQLDLELVQLAAKEDASIKLPSFISYMLNHRGRETHEDFQEFLQKHRLSSHVRVAAVKRDDGGAR